MSKNLDVKVISFTEAQMDIMVNELSGVLVDRRYDYTKERCNSIKELLKIFMLKEVVYYTSIERPD